MSRRIVVLGGTGLFGGAAVELLRAQGAAPLIAARGAARDGGGALDLRLDAEDPDALRSALRPGDVVLDAAGPFQERSAALVEAALEIDFDVVDLSENLGHFLKIDALRPRIEAQGIRVLTSCSSVTTLLAVLVRASGAQAPARVSVYLAPASKVTATAGTGGALRHSLGRPIRILRGGRLVPARGWRESRSFLMPPPIGSARGYLLESAHAATLPRLFPTLRDADFWVDSRVPGLNSVLRLMALAPALAARVGRALRRSTLVARTLGSVAGGMLAEIEETSGVVTQARVFAPRRSYLAAVAPAVLAVHAIASGRFPARGLVPHDRHVGPDELFGYLRQLGIECAFSEPQLAGYP
ncbi:MAG TPA: saccharopine dehydrogenase NADP-binding domain-containing protein [Candidatus Polarisedimenticolia bacterium]|nr:saccharopine dehydrogenase NADP-binding domain-containing protein [Candidatus Polarisedimenticolia bacterium]